MAVIKTLGQLAQILNAQLKGDPHCVVEGIATLQSATSAHISFLSNSTYKKYLANTQAAAVILTAEDAAACPTNALIVTNPYLCYCKLSQLFLEFENITAGIHPSAIIGKNCDIDPSASIGPYCVIGDGVKIAAEVVVGAHGTIGNHCHIGAKTHLWPNVTLYYQSRIGNNCVIHSGVVIGSDGFGFANDKGRWEKIAQLGRVIIGDNVEIGANTTIDRGALDDTIIEEGVKLDNQIQVGHNVTIGAHTAIAGCVAIAGSTTIGKYCAIGGGSCIAGHLSIADKVTITGMSGVHTSIAESGVYSSGTGVQESRTWFKNVTRLRQLDDLAKRFISVEKKLLEFINQAE